MRFLSHDGINSKNGPSLLLDDGKIFNRTGEEAAQPLIGAAACLWDSILKPLQILRKSAGSERAWVDCMGGDNSHEDAQRGAAAAIFAFWLLGCG